MKKTFIVVLISLLILTGCTKKQKVEQEAEDKVEDVIEYKVEDYVEVSPADFDLKINDELLNSGKFKVELSDIKFKNLNESLTTEFLNLHNHYLGKWKVIDATLLTEESYLLDDKLFFKTEIKDTILSVLESSYSVGTNSYSPILQSLNIDLTNMSVIENDKLLEKHQLTLETLYLKILEDSVQYIHTNSLSQSSYGDVTAPQISIDEFKESIPLFAKELTDKMGSDFSEMNFDNNYKYYDDNGPRGFVIALYYNNGKLTVSYRINQILAEINLSSHMGYNIDGEAHELVLE